MKFVIRYTDRFLKAAGSIFSEEELQQIEIYLIKNPEAGKVIRGGHGLRKVRFAIKGQGKSGGARVIYLLLMSEDSITLADCYTKREKDDLTESELKTIYLESSK